MDDDFLEEHGIWEFEARENDIRLFNGQPYKALTVGIEIGPYHIDDAVVATGYSFFIQVPKADFDLYAEKGLIRKIQTAQEFIDEYNELARNNELIGPEVIGSENQMPEDQDEYGLGLDSWRPGSDRPSIPIQLTRIDNAYEFQTNYPFTHVGEVDVEVHGKYDSMSFMGAFISSSETLECKAILGMQLISLMNRFSVGPLEDRGFGMQGLIEY
jgi:hypothetical protein